ncbi:hypothetical protein [Phenylobacterium sp.]|uniref:hypothetical protein n=1 Tax=Phenylobacterium sp. TaxID=1871053 RepID=UPI0025D612E3|nr:hypothetical protein [Phenylobacterium sp.]MCA6361317.1 hypothetical protein [Phenylobacterium sp.]
MTNEELDEARVRAERIRRHRFAARLAREGWTPPEPVVDPDVLAFREWGAADSEADGWTRGAALHRQGHFDLSEGAAAFLAGARMAREQEQERAKVLEDNLALLSEKVALLQAAYRGEA